MARSEGNILKSAPIFAKRNLVFCAAIQVIENNFRQPATSQGSEILYVDDPWRLNSTCSSASHVYLCFEHAIAVKPVIDWQDTI